MVGKWLLVSQWLDSRPSTLHSVSPQGKFIRINFDVTGYIVGANIETCILAEVVYLRPYAVYRYQSKVNG